MYGYIYITTNLINNKQYIGQHKTTKICDGYLGSGIHLKRAIAKYGKENFKKEILCICETEEELNLQEIYYIQKFNAVSSDYFYNIADGGKGHSCKHSDSTRSRISQANKNQIPWNKGLPMSETQKQKISKTKSGKTFSAEHCENIRKSHLGKSKSEETRKKMSESHKNQIPWNKGIKLKKLLDT